MNQYIDHQRSKVYQAEYRWSRKHPDLLKPLTTSQCQKLIERLAKRFDVRTPELRITSMKALLGSYRMNRITLDQMTGKTKATLMHEFAHHLGEGGGHRWGYADAMLRIVEYVCDSDSARELRKSYGDAGICYTRQQEEKRVEKLERAAALAKDRDGEEGSGYIVVKRSRGGEHLMTLSHDKRSWLWGSRGAFDVGVWRRRSTVARYENILTEIVEVEARYSSEERRWMVSQSEIDRVLGKVKV